MVEDRTRGVLEELAELYDLTATLRRECPWDRSQRQEDIIRYTVEETYELADALATGDARRDERVCGELGDLLFQVYFMACVAEEEGRYDLGDVARGIRRKLVRRHPHIFSGASADTPDDVRRTWDEVKRTTEGREGIFHEVPHSFPSTLYANKVQQRAAGVGFDWRSPDEVLDKLREEIVELEEALAASARAVQGEAGRPIAGDPIYDEVGDILFSAVNLARKLGVDPELALRSSTHTFRSRVEAADRMAGAEQLSFAELDLDEQEGFFRRAKGILRGETPEPEPRGGHGDAGGEREGEEDDLDP